MVTGGIGPVPEKARCENCRFAVIEMDTTGDPLRECHRLPPTIVNVFVYRRFGNAIQEGSSGWPVVTDHGWCGEHQFSGDEKYRRWLANISPV